MSRKSLGIVVAFRHSFQWIQYSNLERNHGITRRLHLHGFGSGLQIPTHLRGSNFERLLDTYSSPMHQVRIHSKNIPFCNMLILFQLCLCRFWEFLINLSVFVPSWKICCSSEILVIEFPERLEASQSLFPYTNNWRNNRQDWSQQWYKRWHSNHPYTSAGLGEDFNDHRRHLFRKYVLYGLLHKSPINLRGEKLYCKPFGGLFNDITNMRWYESAYWWNLRRRYWKSYGVQREYCGSHFEGYETSLRSIESWRLH